MAELQKFRDDDRVVVEDLGQVEHGEHGAVTNSWLGLSNAWLYYVMLDGAAEATVWTEGQLRSEPADEAPWNQKR